MEIYLIRHTTPSIAKGICYGQTDVWVEPTLFDKERKLVQKKLPSDIQYGYSSPLRRCTELATKLFDNIQVDARLMELNFGNWEQQAWNNIAPSELNPWMEDFVQVAPPNGESYRELHQRTNAFWEDLLEHNDSPVAVVTHAGVIRSFLSWMLELPLSNSFRIDIAYGGVVHAFIAKDKHYNKLIRIE